MEVASSLGAFGFWIFLAVVVGSGIWFDARKRESQQETLRRLVESGQTIDPAVIDKLVQSSGSERVDRDLKVGGIITLFVAPGIAVLGWFLRQVQEEILGILLGVSLLVAFVGVGLLLAGMYYARAYRNDQG